MCNRVLLLSIHPRHAAKLFQGDKTFEFRRVRPNVSAGDTVLVYVTGPVSAIRGSFTAGSIEQGTPISLWRRFGAKSGLSREELLGYFSGKTIGFAIPINNPKCLRRDIPLQEIVGLLRGFRPPQSYRYITKDQLTVLRSAVKSVERA